ncbi:hypothetical protein HK102_002315 [Quaeritorhiza haematococci]|nr:hypothetical protein HK102_002315 [Quaeritorhiza haematococci]
MKEPAPRGYPGVNAPFDFDHLRSPLAPEAGRPFPCQGKSVKSNIVSLRAGQELPVTIEGGAPHGGGHCQFALSYDNGVTWVVLRTVLDDCLKPEAPNNGLQWSVPIPSDAPNADEALFAWTWINRIGNREYYMNCVDVSISGGSNGGSLTGPRLLVANLPGFVTVDPKGTEGQDGRALLDNRPTINHSPRGTPEGQGVFGRGGEGQNVSQGGAAGKGEGGNNNNNNNNNGGGNRNGNGGGNNGGESRAPARSPDFNPFGSARPSSRKAGSSFTGPTELAPAPPAPAPAAGSECTVGAMRCVGTAAFKQCGPTRTWMPDQAVAPGTVCKQNGDVIMMDHPGATRMRRARRWRMLEA